MAVTSTCTIAWNCPAQGALPAESNSEIITNVTGVGQATTVALSVTPTQLAVPTGTAVIIIQGPSGNVINLLIGSTSSATNCPQFHPTNPIAFPYVAGQNIYLACASSTVTVQVVFI